MSGISSSKSAAGTEGTEVRTNIHKTAKKWMVWGGVILTILLSLYFWNKGGGSTWFSTSSTEGGRLIADLTRARIGEPKIIRMKLDDWVRTKTLMPEYLGPGITTGVCVKVLEPLSAVTDPQMPQVAVQVVNGGDSYEHDWQLVPEAKAVLKKYSYTQVDVAFSLARTTTGVAPKC